MYFIWENIRLEEGREELNLPTIKIITGKYAIERD